MKTTAAAVSNRANRPTRATKDKTQPAASAATSSKKSRASRRSPPVALLTNAIPDAERPVGFAYFNPAAQTVFLAGAFNNWDPARTPMEKAADGRWTVNLMLKPGVYEYRLIV